MARTTPELVAKLIEVDDDTELDSFIDTANSIVTDLCLASGYTTSTLELIERWLACHFVCCRQKQLTMARAGTVSVGYQHKIDMGLNGTDYGQNAMRLDTAGNLAKFENMIKDARKIKVGGTYLGRRPCDYRWRYYPYWCGCY